MWVLERTDTYEVVFISCIVRQVHLIPFFDTRGRARDVLRERRDASDFDMYFLNHHSDRYAYIYFQ
jgi:hypothetical protein